MASSIPSHAQYSQQVSMAREQTESPEVSKASSVASTEPTSASSTAALTSYIIVFRDPPTKWWTDAVEEHIRDSGWSTASCEPASPALGIVLVGTKVPTVYSFTTDIDLSVRALRQVEDLYACTIHRDPESDDELAKVDGKEEKRDDGQYAVVGPAVGRRKNAELVPESERSSGAKSVRDEGGKRCASTNPFALLASHEDMDWMRAGPTRTGCETMTRHTSVGSKSPKRRGRGRATMRKAKQTETDVSVRNIETPCEDATHQVALQNSPTNRYSMKDNLRFGISIFMLICALPIRSDIEWIKVLLIFATTMLLYVTEKWWV